MNILLTTGFFQDFAGSMLTGNYNFNVLNEYWHKLKLFDFGKKLIIPLNLNRNHFLTIVIEF